MPRATGVWAASWPDGARSMAPPTGMRLAPIGSRGACVLRLLLLLLLLHELHALLHQSPVHRQQAVLMVRKERAGGPQGLLVGLQITLPGCQTMGSLTTRN
jgi:hypothetical protein